MDRQEQTPASASDPTRTDSRYEESESTQHSAGSHEGPADQPADQQDNRMSSAKLNDATEAPVKRPNMWLLLPSLSLLIFVASLDQTIVGTALPKISSELHATSLQYSWVASSYLLTIVVTVALAPRIADILGTLPVMYGSLALFFISSALCGSAKNMAWLICGRAFQGMGGGALIVMMLGTTAKVSPPERRAEYTGYVNLSYTFAAAIGPIIGGALAEKVSWRWCFYINLPICAAATVLLALFLRLEEDRSRSAGSVFKQFKETYDFVGLLLVAGGAGLLTSGFSLSADSGFDSPAVIALIVVGGALLLASPINSLYTKRNAVIPPILFRNPTAILFLLSAVLNSACFTPATFLLPQLFQGSRGDGPIQGGVDLLPLSIVFSVTAAVASRLISRYHVNRPVAWSGNIISAIGYGLFARYLTVYPTSYAKQEGLQILVGFGLGLSVLPPLFAAQAVLPKKDQGAAAGAYMLCRSTGAVMGSAIMLPVFSSSLRTKLEAIPGYGTVFQFPDGTQGYRALHDIPDPEIRAQVLNGFASAMKSDWLIAMAFCLAALVITLPTKGAKPDNAEETAVEAKSSAFAMPLRAINNARERVRFKRHSITE